MKLISKLIKKTYLKYFLSYAILFTVLMAGFFLILRNQIISRYFDLRCEQALLQLDNISEKLNNDLVYLSQVDTSLNKNMEIIMSKYKDESAYRIQTYSELNKYATTAPLVNSIVYIPKTTGTAISTMHLVSYRDGILDITLHSGNTITFDPSPYYNNSSGQLIFLSSKRDQLLLYFPVLRASANYLYFYTLDTTYIEQQLKSMLSNELLSMALIDQDNQFVVGVNDEQFLPYAESFQIEDGVYPLDSSTSVCVHTGINSNFSMIALLSNDFLLQQVNAAFAKTYLALLSLSILGFISILFAMRITYVPLRKLTQKVVGDSDISQGYLDQLDREFSKTTMQNQILQEKLQHYRISMQKSLLDSITTSNLPKDAHLLTNIDSFFDTTSAKEIFAVKMSAPGQKLPCFKILDFFQNMLPSKDSCVLLESTVDSAVFLINYIGTEPNKDAVLIELLNNLHEEAGYLAAISNGSTSPLDIPSLYENVTRASDYWTQTPVVDYKTLPSASANFTYPYELINQLSEALKSNDFTTSKNHINQLFEIVDHSVSIGSNMPDFFIRSILIDMLTVIFNCMGTSNIKFESYSDLYFETLYFCRSCSYTEKAETITENMNKLIEFYEQEFSSRVVNPAQIRQIIEEAYCQPDFSITVLADKFHVSIAYMSYLIKNEINQNFSDYLWTLRLEKSKELLRNTDMSIDEISVAVGYLNTSSFRRKFKQEVGMTPSQFRSE